MIGRRVGGVDAPGFHRVDRMQGLSDLRPAVDAQRNVAVGTDEWQRCVGSPGATARTMSMREMIVPKSFDAQRTKAKTTPGGKLTIRRRRSRTCSSAICPKRIRVLDALLEPGQLDMRQHGRSIILTARGLLRWRSLRVSVFVGEFAGEQLAQRLCHGNGSGLRFGG